MEYKATVRYLRGSAQKVRLVADLIRGRNVQDAVNVLQVTNKHAARPMEKALRSALANAENREEGVDVDRLFVQEIQVDGGPSIKRLRPAPQGRAFRILKRQSHVTIKLGVRPEGGNAGETGAARTAQS
jgi:large subunit ribosomal protein L22